MFTVSASVPINPPGVEPRLSAEQLWRGLQIRARNGDERFVPPGHRFEVLEDQGDWLTRRVILDDRADELQKISFHGGRVMLFEFVEGGQRSVIVTAIESDDDGEHHLRMTFLVEFVAMPHNSAQEREIAELRRPMMRKQPQTIIDISRELVREGRI